MIDLNKLDKTLAELRVEMIRLGMPHARLEDVTAIRRTLTAVEEARKRVR